MAPARPQLHNSRTGLDRATLVVAGVVTLGVIMSILDTTIVNVALASLARDLGASIDTVQWVATGYLLSLAIVIPLAGWLSERFGSKRVWMVSVALFGLGSALCGLASSAGSLIFFRVLQGLGGGLIMPVSMTILAQAAGPRHMGRIMSVLGVPTLLGPVLGPVIGGLIVDSVSWRWIFYVNVPIAIVALLLARRVLAADAGRVDAGRLDRVGFALLSPGLAATVFGLSETESHGGFGAPIVFLSLVAGAVLVGLFAWHAVRAPRPLIDVKLFRSPSFRAAAVTVFFIGATLFGGMFVLALYFQSARGASALDAGLLLAPQGLGAALAMPFSGRVTDRIGGDRVVWAGCVVMTIATVPLAWVTGATSEAVLAALLAVRGVGFGWAMMPTMAAAYARLRSSDVPRATSALNATQRVGGSLGTAVIAVVLQGQIGDGRPLDTAFAHTFAWAAAITALSIAPAVLLAFAGRSARTSTSNKEIQDGNSIAHSRSAPQRAGRRDVQQLPGGAASGRQLVRQRLPGRVHRRGRA